MLIFKDRVRETTTSTGTGNYTRAGAPTGYQAFSVVGSGNQCVYCATDNTNWEITLGTVGASDLSRDLVLASSNAGAAVNWGAGTKDLRLVQAGAYVVPPTGLKNKIIGGEFSINPWDRGNTLTAPTTGLYTANMWVTSYTGAMVFDIIRTVDAPTPAQAGVYARNCLHVDITTADASIAAGDQLTISTYIEGYNMVACGFGQAGTRYVTLSFWVKGAVTGTHCVSFCNAAGDRSYVATYTISSANTWEFKVLRIPVDTSGTWDYTSGIGLRVRFSLAAGSTYQTTGGTWTAGNFLATSAQVNECSSTANNFKLALVQLEYGEAPTPFEIRDAGTELSLCRRYLPAFRATTTVDYFATAGAAFSSTSTRINYHFEIEPRVPPTGILISSASHFSINDAGTTAACTAVTFTAATKRVGRLQADVASGLTTGHAVDIYANSVSATLFWTGAEL